MMYHRFYHDILFASRISKQIFRVGSRRHISIPFVSNIVDGCCAYRHEVRSYHDTSSSSSNNYKFTQCLSSVIDRMQRVGNRDSNVSKGGRKMYKSYNPNTGDVISEYAVASQHDVDDAVGSARAAFKEGLDRNMDGSILMNASEVLNRAAYLVETKYREELAYIESLDSGIPISQTRYHMDAVVDCLRYYAGVAAVGFPKQGVSMELEREANAFCYTRREPLGVVAGIGAWNYPLLLLIWKLAPAFASGNAMVYKPSECTIMTAILFESIFREAGAHHDMFQVVLGDAEVGRMLTTHRHIENIAFTGSTNAGIEISKSASESMKTCTLELGGKSPLLVFADADLGRAVEVAINGNFVNNGEVCTNCTRVYVHKSIIEKFLELLVQKTKKLTIGNSLKDEVCVGPLIMYPTNPTSHVDSVSSMIEGAKIDRSCELVHGGSVDGQFVTPTIFKCEANNSGIVQHEIFGPVMCVLSFEDDLDALNMANNSKYGLAAGIMTKNLSRAHSLAQKLDVGYVWINNYNLTPVQLPFGGRKMSGHGKELGLDPILHHYTHTKTVYVDLENGNEIPTPF